MGNMALVWKRFNPSVITKELRLYNSSSKDTLDGRRWKNYLQMTVLTKI